MFPQSARVYHWDARGGARSGFNGRRLGGFREKFYAVWNVSFCLHKRFAPESICFLNPEECVRVIGELVMVVKITGRTWAIQ